MKYSGNMISKVQIGDNVEINRQIDNMMTVKEVSMLLHVHPNTLRRWADKGIIASFRINTRGDRRFLTQDIISYLHKNNTHNKQ
jgi:excisionase family DNA binding protein